MPSSHVMHAEPSSHVTHAVPSSHAMIWKLSFLCEASQSHVDESLGELGEDIMHCGECSDTNVSTIQTCQCRRPLRAWKHFMGRRRSIMCNQWSTVFTGTHLDGDAETGLEMCVFGGPQNQEPKQAPSF